MVATNDDIVREIQNLNKTLKLIHGINIDDNQIAVELQKLPTKAI